MPQLNNSDFAALRHLAAVLIPMDTRRGLPGADDDAIFAEIRAELGKAHFDATPLLVALREHAAESSATALAAHLRLAAGAACVTFVSAVAFCYYRDDRVLRSLGIEARAPFPQGYSIEAGDWSLLDPQRARAGFWRKP